MKYKFIFVFNMQCVTNKLEKSTKNYINIRKMGGKNEKKLFYKKSHKRKIQRT